MESHLCSSSFYKFLIPAIDLSPNGEEYIYNYNTAWSDVVGIVEVENYKIIENLKLNNCKYNRMCTFKYTFNFKGSSVLHHCDYDWAFVPNTLDNLNQLKKIENELRPAIEMLQREISAIYDEITLRKSNSKPSAGER